MRIPLQTKWNLFGRSALPRRLAKSNKKLAFGHQTLASVFVVTRILKSLINKFQLRRQALRFTYEKSGSVVKPYRLFFNLISL